MSRPALILRQMRAEELPLVLDWAAAEGWNPGLDDAGAFLAADPAGFFVAGVAGQIVAAISVVNHGAENAFLGLYICRPDWRGRGVGLDLWSRALVHAGTRSVGLDGVAAQQANYERSGFVRTGATTRLAGRLEGQPDSMIRPVGQADIAGLVALDAAAAGYPRARFLTEWLKPSPGRLSLLLQAGAGAGAGAETGAGAAGFATIRRCRQGAKIGPVIAPDAEMAMRLIRAAIAACPSDQILIDLPDLATQLGAGLTAIGFRPVFATARMYRGAPPQTTTALQAIATMELG